ncbi:MAG: Ig-like domain-containing protein [Limisphaerales bacterium]
MRSHYHRAHPFLRVHRRQRSSKTLHPELLASFTLTDLFEFLRGRLEDAPSGRKKGPLTANTSANGGTVATNSGWILYTPALGFTNTDTFTYAVSDGWGSPVTGVVTVNVIRCPAR